MGSTDRVTLYQELAAQYRELDKRLRRLRDRMSVAERCEACRPDLLVEQQQLLDLLVEKRQVLWQEVPERLRAEWVTSALVRLGVLAWLTKDEFEGPPNYTLWRDTYFCLAED